MGGPQSNVIRRGRDFHNRLMTSKIRIYRVTGKTTNHTTLKAIDTVETIYQGKGKVRIAAASAGISEREPLGQQLAFQEAILSAPVVADLDSGEVGDTGNVTSGDYVEFIANDEDDDAIVGTTWRIKAPHFQSSQTQRRFMVERIS